MEETSKPTILVTNDNGIHAPGLRALVQVLVATNRYNIQVAAPDRGYKLTKQGRSCIKMGWKQITSETRGQKMTSAMTMDTETTAPTETHSLSVSPGHLIFKREVTSAQYDADDNDYKFLQEGYITVTPLAALANVEGDCHAYFKDMLQKVSEHSSPTVI